MSRTFVLVGLFTGCSSYSVKEPQFTEPEAMPYTQTEGMVLIGVDPYVQSDKVIALFGEDLQAVSVIPIQVVVRNMGERPFRVETKNFKLSLPSEEVVAPRPGSDVAGLFSPHSDVLDHAATGIRLLGGLGGAIGGLVASVVEGVASVSIKGSQRDAQLARQEDYTRKELKGVTLGTSESTRGFLFFSLPAGTAAFNEATLILDAYGSDTDNRSIKIPLKNLGYKGKAASDK